MKYVMANIKLPLSIKPDGYIEPLIEYISISIDKCDSLPERVDPTISQTDFFKQIQSLLSEKSISNEPIIEPPVEINLTILPDEIAYHKDKNAPKNSTLKNYKGISSKKYRSTMKNHHSISNS